MRTETIEIYQFHELSESAQENAIDRYRERQTEWAWSDEWRQSMEVFADLLGITVKDWEVSLCSPSYVRWEYEPAKWWPAYEDPGETMTGLRLRTYLINNWLPQFQRRKTYSNFYKRENGILKTSGKNTKRLSNVTQETDAGTMTGYCADYSLLQPALNFIEKPNDRETLNTIIDDCFNEWLKDWISDIEWQNSDEYIREEIAINGYGFLEDGSIH